MNRAGRDKKLLNVAALRDCPKAKSYLIGVSGGRDSVALLHSLGAQGYRKLIVCHLEHGLRGRSGKAAARFVERLAKSHGLSFEGGSAEVSKLAATKKQSIETAARAARYAFFAEVARRRGCRRIFLAHHADDLVETFLLNLFRGAGPLGLSAMRRVTQQNIEGVKLEVIRPLLSIWRSEIDLYLTSHGLKFREDITNESLVPRRNRTRHRIIPYLERQFGRPVRQNIWRAAVIAAEEEQWLASLVAAENPDVSDLSVTNLREQPVALQRRVIFAWLRERGVRNLDYEGIERVRALLERGTDVAKTNLPGDRHVRRRAKRIFLESPAKRSAKA